MSSSWKDVWNKKIVDSQNDGLLDSLIKANGFDGGPGNYLATDYLDMVEDMVRHLDIKENHKVLEVGCGSGALLYSISQLSGAKIYGYDYSASLISEARRFVNGFFKVSEAISCPFTEMKFDFVISHSVFQYFPDKSYARDVICSMSNLILAGGKIAIYDLNDSEKEFEYHSLRRQSCDDPSLYDSKYKNLKHLFYDKNEIYEQLKHLGFKDLTFPPHSSLNYENARFRFNIYGTK